MADILMKALTGQGGLDRRSGARGELQLTRAALWDALPRIWCMCALLAFPILLSGCLDPPGSPYDPARCESSEYGCDVDGDGESAEEGDCDDSDPEVGTYQWEVCDGKDNDCDGHVDEDMYTEIQYVDQDQDGYGVPGTGQALCAGMPGYAFYSGDCDDTNPEVYPYATEYCDGIDNNCDQEVDEYCGS